MPRKEKMPEPFFEPFRVLKYYDEKSKFFVAHCLETGNVVSADDENTLTDMIKELLEDEISYAIVHKNLKNLFSSPAPLDIRTSWYKAAQENGTKTIPLNISARELRLDEPDEASTEVKIANAAA